MRYWVFTTKPGHFDMEKALIPGETLDWPGFSHFKFEVGDLVFFYASSPVAQLIGKLEIERKDLDFSEVDPRNDLRKWPRHNSTIGWLRLRVLQRAPIPFKPLQRGSLYYHTQFKPSPYPKLLHESEQEYVLRAFDSAMTYAADMLRHEGGLQPAALAKVSGADILRRTVEKLRDARILRNEFDVQGGVMTLVLRSGEGEDADEVTLRFGGVRRVRYEYERESALVHSIRLTIEDIYLLANFDGADLEILAETLTVN